jgi:hypothetical protein
VREKIIQPYWPRRQKFAIPCIQRILRRHEFI